MMHTAYNVQQILKLPLTIECLAAFKEHLLLGTRAGHLLMYSVQNRGKNGANEAGQSGVSSEDNFSSSPNTSSTSLSGSTSQEAPKLQLMRTNKNFSKKPILKLEAIPEYSILIALTDGNISVHDLDPVATNFPCIFSVTKVKGAHIFAVDVVRQKSLTGETSVTVRMVVAVKRKLSFFYWKNRKFHDLYPDITLPDTPKSLAWAKETVCVGLRSDYSLINLNSPNHDEVCHLFPTGKNQEPSITYLGDERFALGKDEQTTFIDLNGNLKMYAINWSDAPKSLAFDPPYVIAVTSNGVEVRTEEPKLSIQKIDVSGAKFVSSSGEWGSVYIASGSQIWLMDMVSVSNQIPQLLRDKQFQLAKVLSDYGNESSDKKSKRAQKIQTLYAFDLFCNHKFKDSMEVFFDLDIDPSHVIGLFSDLLPKEFRNRLSFPDKPPVLQGRELENALQALIEYLTKTRHRLNGINSKAIEPMPLTDKSVVIKSKRQMMQVLDTTLLKCYLKTNDALVAPLLRLKDNNCHIDETERALIRSHKFSELVIFYNSKGLHDKALTLLKEHYDRKDSPISGTFRTVEYLQNLGPENIQTICKYAEWVLHEDESLGLSIFIEDEPEVKSLPRAKVLEFLTKSKKSAVIPYLKHIILNWGEKNPVFHNALILCYKDKLQAMMDQQQNSTEVEQKRTELQELITSSTNYQPEVVLPQFPHDRLQEERAILLGKMSKHKEALTLYLFHVKDLESAKVHCQKHYPSSKDVYTHLVHLLLKPPEQHILKELGVKDFQKVRSNLQEAMSVLNEHGEKVDMTSTLKLLPDNVPLTMMTKFLSTKMEERVAKRHHLQVLRSLLHAEHLQVQEERITIQSNKIVIGELDVCRVCHKRFNNQGAFVRLPNSEIVHLSCKDKANVFF